MEKNTYTMRAEIWLYPGSTHTRDAKSGAWHFITLPQKQSAEIKKRFGIKKRGWGSLPVEATILQRGRGQVGRTTWRTSIFPDSKSGSYLLPVKADVRKKEGVEAGDRVTFSIRVGV